MDERNMRAGVRGVESAAAAKAVLTGGALLGGLSVARSAHAAGSDVIKIALIGCGGRGTGAAMNALSTKANVRLVAMADSFTDRLNGSYAAVKQAFADKPEKVDVPPERRFSEMDGYHKAIAAGVDVVLLCSPPGFRPAQYEAAVRAGKHVFMEKPVATDAPGVRRIMATNDEAKKKGLSVAVGHHLRHEIKHKECLARIHDGAIGAVKFARIYFNSSGVWVMPRQPGQTEMQHQVRNWYYFTWLSGDHIVEQHVHDIDVANWMMRAHPVRANGMGGRQVRIGPQYGEIFDHHSVEFEYADGARTFSVCRHIPNCWDSFLEVCHGTKGYAHIEGHGAALLQVDGEKPQKWARGPDGHQLEMDNLFAALAAGKTVFEGDYGAEATMTAILGRMATYSGQVVSWDEAIQSNVNLTPDRLQWDAPTKVAAGRDGIYPCAVPGVTKVI